MKLIFHAKFLKWRRGKERQLYGQVYGPAGILLYISKNEAFVMLCKIEFIVFWKYDWDQGGKGDIITKHKTHLTR